MDRCRGRCGPRWGENRPRGRQVAESMLRQIPSLHLGTARRSNSDFVTGPARRSTNGSASSNNTPFVDERASGLAVDENVVARSSKEPQISTDLNRPSGRSLTGKHLKTDHLRYSAWGVWGARGPGFKSRQPDQTLHRLTARDTLRFYLLESNWSPLWERQRHSSRSEPKRSHEFTGALYSL
jgi:hypothetical protein